MIINLESPEFDQYSVHDCFDNILTYVREYNTETKEVTMSLLCVTSDGQTRFLVQPTENGIYESVVTKFVLPGSFATYKGELVK